jgi:hypothetical protein
MASHIEVTSSGPYPVGGENVAGLWTLDEFAVSGVSFVAYIAATPEIPENWEIFLDLTIGREITPEEISSNHVDFPGIYNDINPYGPRLYQFVLEVHNGEDVYYLASESWEATAVSSGGCLLLTRRRMAVI